jgi:aminoglycoside phosphotransferase (APT) family kinase protein
VATAPDEEGLREVLAEALGVDDPAVRDLHPLSGGASRATWSLTADDGSWRRPLILQLGEPRSETNPRPGMDYEGRAIRAAADAGVPVPRLLACSGEPDQLGAPFLLSEHVEGETIARRILRDDEFAGARRVLAHQCGAALARIHSVPAEALGSEAPTDDPLDRYREALDELGPPQPTFELAFRELAATRPPAARHTVVHGDFRLGNLIIGPDGLRAAIDWELVHTGDPMEDLGWMCTKAWRFGGEPTVGGFGTVEDLMAGYEEAAGVAADPAAVRWWTVFGSLKWGIICVQQGFVHLGRWRRSVEHAAIGRRVCENEWDLLEYLA